MVRCSNCGNNISSNLTYCPKCGASLETDNILEGPIKKKSHKKQILLLITSVIIIISICILVALNF